MKHIIERILRFAKEKKGKKKSKAEEPEQEVTKETSDKQEEKPAIDVQAFALPAKYPVSAFSQPLFRQLNTGIVSTGYD